MRYSFTIVLSILALILGGLAVVHTGSSYRAAIFGTTATAPGEKLFALKEIDKVRHITLTNSDGDVASFHIAGHFWQAKTPWKDRADPLFIKFLIQFTTRLKVQEVIPREHLNLKEFGLRDGHIRVTMRDAKGQDVCDYRIGRPTAWKIPSEDGKTTQPTLFIRKVPKTLKNNIYICSEDSAQSIHALFKSQFARFRDHHPFHFSPRYLDKVRIQNNEGEVVISRKDLKSGWLITKPLELRLDPQAQANLFKDLARLTAIKVEDRASVTLPTAEDDTSQAREISLHFAGAKDDVTLRIYPPAKDGDPITLATVSDRPDAVFHLPLTAAAGIPGSTSLSQLQTGVNDLRSKTMTHLNGPQLKTIIIRPTGRPDTMLKRTKKTTWRVLRRKGWEAANQDAVIDLMLAVTRDKVQKFVTDAATDLSPYGLDQPMLQVGFISFNNEGMRIAIGQGPTGDHLYAHVVGRPNIWEISNETLGKIAIHPWQWRTSHVWHIPKVDINGIRIEKNGQPTVDLKYAFFAEKWEATEDGEDATARLNPNRANAFLSHIESLATSQWLGPLHTQATKALRTPDTVIQMSIKGVDDEGKDMPPIVKTLQIAHTQGKLIYFAKVHTAPRDPRHDDEDSYFLLTPETVDQLYVDLFE
ncbi:MAG: DUF4340 domain-containing protein [Verrucomicrobiae bacterium]|nr:DUF4340 domain-containing protein [Verrucomicrobiae bacterium]NNJ41879.1 DUF4340 domain-containing protein [Akkermansiaceae bacterium]